VNDFRVDPDSLVAASRLAQRQHGHIADVSTYIQTACSKTGAFTGVMNLFQGSYESALDTATQGMDDSMAVAQKAKRSFRLAATAYRDHDREAYERARKALGPLGKLNPYTPVGSGVTAPGGPTEDPLQPPKADDDSPFQIKNVLKLPEPDLPWAVDGVKDTASDAVDNAMPGSDAPDTPAWTDPTGAVKDHVTDTVLSNLKRHEYLALRHSGLSHEDAMKQLFPDADTRANALEDLRTSQDSVRNYRDVYDQRIAAGDDPATATRHAQDAADTTRHYADEDRRQRTNVDHHAANAKGAYDAATTAVDNVNQTIDSVDNIIDNVKDAERYRDYQDGDHDRDAEEWAGR